MESANKSVAEDDTKLYQIWKKSWREQVISATKFWTFTPREAAIDLISTVRTSMWGLFIVYVLPPLKAFFGKLIGFFGALGSVLLGS